MAESKEQQHVEFTQDNEQNNDIDSNSTTTNHNPKADNNPIETPTSSRSPSPTPSDVESKVMHQQSIEMTFSGDDELQTNSHEPEDCINSNEDANGNEEDAEMQGLQDKLDIVEDAPEANSEIEARTPQEVAPTPDDAIKESSGSEPQEHHRQQQHESDSPSVTRNRTPPLPHHISQHEDQPPGSPVDMPRQSSKPASPLPGLVFIVNAFEKLLGTREGKKRESKEEITEALNMLKPKLGKSQPLSESESSWLKRSEIESILAALDIVSSPQSTPVTAVVVIDCIEKLVSFHYFENVSDLPNADSIAASIKSSQQLDSAMAADSVRVEVANAAKKRSEYLRDISERLIDIVSRFFHGEGTAENVQLQIVKALFALMSSENLNIKQAVMLKCIRITYSIFVLSHNMANQTIAQGTLTQMVHLVLSRVPVELDNDEDIDDEEDEEIGSNGSREDSANVPDNDKARSPNIASNDSHGADGSESSDVVDDTAARDAFHMIRALCKISMRPIPGDHSFDSKSPALRSRTLALNLIRLAFSEHTDVFTSSHIYLRSASSIGGISADDRNEHEDQIKQSEHSSNPFPFASRKPSSTSEFGEDEFGDTEDPDRAIPTQLERTASSQKSQTSAADEPTKTTKTLDSGSIAVPLITVLRQYLSLALSRNLVSSNAIVLDLGLAVFELAVVHMRAYMKREMEVLFREIILPVLENKGSGTQYQRGRILQSLVKILSHPSLVVELYLNYDCNEDSSISIFQRLAEVLCKLGGNYVQVPQKNSPHYFYGNPSAEASSEGSTVIAAAWRAVQQRQTVFNTPLAQVLESANLLSTTGRTEGPSRSNLAPSQLNGSGSATRSSSGAPLSSVSNGQATEQRSVRGSRTFSMSSQNTAAISSNGVAQISISMLYGGINYAASEKLQGTANAIDEYSVRQWALDALVMLLQSMVVWSDRMAGPLNAADLSENPETNGVSAPTTNGSNAHNTPSDTGVMPSPGLDTDGSQHSTPNGFYRGRMSASATVAADDPEELSNIKHRKEKFEEARKLFAWKPKKGIAAWKSGGFIKSNEPCEVAKFLYANKDQGLDKMQIGEYLGEGDAYNIAVMHAFVDCMEFSNLDFVSSLRLFLQSFRLPGEAQKIDRFMLKFAERYLIGNPQAGFANADAAYVLAYSTILLNTDQHSPQIKVRMTKKEFINNNRGINDGNNLDPEFLEQIFDAIVRDEIKLKDDPLEGKIPGSGQGQVSGPLFDLWGSGTANRIREQHAHASAEMAAKSEQSIRSMSRLRRTLRRSSVSVPAAISAADSAEPASAETWATLLDMTDFLRATRPDHIAPMFGTIWAAALAALSSPMQTVSDPHVIAACLVGFQCGISLACRFRMPLERSTFVTTLRNFTQLQNLAEMKRKHVEAIRALVEVATSRPDVGNGLCENWLDVLQCVSQLERLQLITQGSESVSGAASVRATSSMDVGSMFGFSIGMGNNGNNAHNISARALSPSASPAASVSTTAGSSGYAQGLRSQIPSVSIAELAKLETNSQVLVVMVDRLFTSSVYLSGSGIVDFVRALSKVAWNEITSTFRIDDTATGDLQANATKKKQQQRRASSAVITTTQPPASRLFSMTKIVEISYYNMGRIRVEWSQIWAILGPLFDRVGAYTDTRAALFALDSLRQLSTKFLEKEELPHFAFQKEFLRPFADVLEGFVPDLDKPVTVDVQVKDMVLRCVRQLVQAAATHIRSGWKAILNVAQIAAHDANEMIAEMGFQLVSECAELHSMQMWKLVPVSVPTVRSTKGKEDENVRVVSVAGIEYFHELVDCLNEYAVESANKRPRLALNAIDALQGVAGRLGLQVLSHAEYTDEASEKVRLDDQPLYRIWMPVLRALYEIVMHTEDLEVRTRALDTFFRLIMTHGSNFSAELWACVLRELVFTMFYDLRDPSASRRFATVDDLELWFSTTLIKALRHVVSLFTRYYPERLPGALLSEILDLLTLCIVQPSEILGKIGTSCLQDLVRNNYTKWDNDAWGLVCETFVKLFNWSQPRELFSIAGASWEAQEREATKSREQGVISNASGLNGEQLPVISPVQKRSGDKATPISSQLTNVARPSPLRTTLTASSLLSSNDGNDSPSPSITTPGSATEDGQRQTFAEESSDVADDTTSKVNLLPAALAVSSSSMLAPSSDDTDSPDYLHITLKCILQLLLIQTIAELFSFDDIAPESESGSSSHERTHNDADNMEVCDIYNSMSAHHLFILLDCLDQSRIFARRFNESSRVRRRLVEMGVMPTMPSLLKQETSSALTQLHLLQRMNMDGLSGSFIKTTNARHNGVVKKPVELIRDRVAVIDEVDDRLNTIMRSVLLQYNGSASVADASGKNVVVPVSLTENQDPSEVSRRSMLQASWRPCVIAVVRYLPKLDEWAGETDENMDTPFRRAVKPIWWHLVGLVGVSAAAGDLDVVGEVQRVFVGVGKEFGVGLEKSLTV